MDLASITVRLKMPPKPRKAFVGPPNVIESVSNGVEERVDMVEVRDDDDEEKLFDVTVDLVWIDLVDSLIGCWLIELLID
jgi:hypothetical protein